MSEVRVGEDLLLDRPVAVKLLRRDLAEQPAMRRRFADEARAAARLSHPNVVAIHDTGEHGGVPYIVMEYLPGRSLADELADGPLEQGRACELAMQVLAALDAAHREGVVHRDVKPSNVLLTPDGIAKVADFGIAKVAESDDATTTGTLFGTPGYLAPERVAGEPATPRSDIYAVGVVLYEALTGTKPFVGDTPLAVMNAIHLGEPQRLSVLRPDLDPSIVAAVECAMNKDVEARFRSAAAMIQALPGGAGVSVGTELEPTMRIEATEAALGFGADVAATQKVDLTIGADPTRRLPSEREPRSRANGRLVAVLAAVVVGFVVGLLALLSTVGGDDSNPGDAPATTAPVSEPALSDSLDDAIRELEEAIQP